MSRKKSRKETFKNFSMYKKIICLVHDICPSFIPLTITENILDATGTFLGIVLSAKIITGIEEKMTETRLLQTAFLLVTSGLIVTLLMWAVNKTLIVKKRLINDTLNARIAKKALTLDYQVLEKSQTLDYIERAREGCNSSGDISTYCSIIGHFVNSIITIIYACVILMPFFTKSREGFILLTLMVAVIICNNFVFRKINKLDYVFFEFNVDSNRKYGFFYKYLYDYQSGKTIRIYNMQNFIMNKMLNQRKSLNKASVSFGKKGANYLSICNILIFIMEFACYLLVGLKVISQTISIGELTLYVATFNLLRRTVTDIMEEYGAMVTRNKYLINYTQFLDLKNEKYDGTLPVEKRLDNEYELEFCNVSFHYPNNNEQILKNITTKIHVGKKMAIVGKNGSGKSTFIKLLCRLYDPTEGHILLNGIDIRKYDYDEYRDIFSVVFQDFKLFSFPIAENIAADTEYDSDRVNLCLSQAGMGERIHSLKNGIREVLYKHDDEGVEISGGEAQKIAIARALYKNSPIVILDEPTSALDPASELEVYEHFDSMVNEKTAVYISHRMSSCRFCDNILVFDNGNIVQTGSHDSLLKDENGLYKKLWDAQAQYYI